MTRKIILTGLFLAIPVIAFGAVFDPIVKCDGTDIPCDFNAFIGLGNSIIKFLIEIGAFLGAISFAWAGWLYVTSGGNPGTIDKAKDIFWKVIVGFILMLAAWLIIKLVIASLGYKGTGLDFISDLVR